jgi:parallel beta-helix repeat protein
VLPHVSIRHIVQQKFPIRVGRGFVHCVFEIAKNPAETGLVVTDGLAEVFARGGREFGLSGIRDAALYVGQSRDIVVKGNEVYGNVTGIEIENSVNAVVEGNYAHDNTGGILVFLLPNNPSKVGTDTKVVNNRVTSNNHPNFGDPNAIVSQVPPGTGIFIMAADRTEVTGNEVRGNDSFGVAVVSLASAFPRGTSFDVGIVPEGNRIFGNTLAENGRNPAAAIKAAAKPMESEESRPKESFSVDSPVRRCGDDTAWRASGTNAIAAGCFNKNPTARRPPAMNRLKLRRESCSEKPSA